jgi:hypothetical protein
MLNVLLVGVMVAMNSHDLSSLTLVRAKVVTVTPATGWPEGSIATVEVAHVYRGDPGMVGKTFSDRSITLTGGGFASVGPQFHVYKFNVDDEGIWSLARRGDKVHPAVDPRLTFACRSCKASDPRYARIVALAEAVERYMKAKPGDRPALAKALAQDAVPEVGYWVVHTVGASCAKFSTDLLAEWRSKADLPLGAGIALDEVLCTREREGWFFTPERTALLKGWVSGKADEHLTTRVIDRLDIASQRGELRGDKAVELLQAAALNKEWRKEDRLKAIRRACELAHRLVDHQAAYDWLFDQMKSNPDADVRKSAAGAVGSLSTYPKRLKAIEEHLATEKDAEVANALRDAVLRAKEADKK